MSCGIGPNGSPRKSVSVPARITRMPRAASVTTRAMIPASRNCASSIATTSASSRRFDGDRLDDASIGAVDGEDAAVAIIEMRLEDLRALLGDDRPAHATDEL